MAAKNTSVVIASANANDLSFTSGAGAQNNVRQLINHLEGGLNGAHTIRTVTIRDSTVAGSLTITLVSMAAGTVLLINGVPFTSKGTAATTGNNEFDISGGTDTLDAAALAAAINASTTAGITGVLTATSALGVVTLTASAPGAGSNAITVENLGVVATGTVTCAGVDAADAIAINGQAITAHATVAANNQFVVGASNAATATNLAACINGSTTAIVSKHVRALARAAVVHLFARYGGPAGNAITLTTTDGTDLAVSGTGRLEGGTLAQYEGAQATVGLSVGAPDGGTYRTTINGVNVDVTGSIGDAAATVALIVAAINNSVNPLVRDSVYAVAESPDVTLVARRGGHPGNAVTVSVTGTEYTADGARLTTGALPTVSVVTGGTQTAVGGGANMAGGSNSTAIVCTL